MPGGSRRLPHVRVVERSLSGALPDATHVIIVVLASYTVLLGTIAFWILERRDVHGATVG